MYLGWTRRQAEGTYLVGWLLADRHQGEDVTDKRRYTVAEIAATFHVSRKTIYRHLEPTSTPTT
jgi:hypothetical protein